LSIEIYEHCFVTSVLQWKMLGTYTVLFLLYEGTYSHITLCVYVLNVGTHVLEMWRLCSKRGYRGRCYVGSRYNIERHRKITHFKLIYVQHSRRKN
jgi:hypothetical protein